jgi:L-lysine 2,3-aminomutase
MANEVIFLPSGAKICTKDANCDYCFRKDTCGYIHMRGWSSEKIYNWLNHKYIKNHIDMGMN